MADDQQQQAHQELETQLWRMRWFILIVVSIGFLATIGISIAMLIITKNPLSLVIPSAIVLIMRPILRFLFPQPNQQRGKNDNEKVKP